MESILELRIHLDRRAHLQFDVNVEAERYFDFLMFVVDSLVLYRRDRYVPSLSLRTNGWTTWGTDIEPGYHILSWIYYKDFSGEYGMDRAQLRNIILTGT